MLKAASHDHRELIIPLADAFDGGVFGGKAVQLGLGIRNGLPVPRGYALSPDAVAALSREDPAAVAALERVSAELGLTAVRSSALDEDSAGASFAGAHLTVLAVSGLGATIAAVRAVQQSGQDAGAQSYRDKLGLGSASVMAVVVQSFIDADMAGVLFTRNPLTSADERVVEANWGLGEAVVSGLVTPDRYRVARGGRMLERTLGDKDVAIRPVISAEAEVRTEEVPVAPDMIGVFCLGDAELTTLDRLASDCDRVYGSSEHDIEFAFGGGELFLLQRRPITGG